MNIKMKDMNGNVLFPSLQLPDNIATKEYVQTELEKFEEEDLVYYEDGAAAVQENSINALANIIYPIGSIYMSVNNTNPSILFGGDWVQIKDKFLLSAGDTYAAGTGGGEATHVLTQAETPAHTHTRGTMNITGGCNYFGHTSNVSWGLNTADSGWFGAMYGFNGGGSCYNKATTNCNSYTSSDGGKYSGIKFDASRVWTGETSSVGSNGAHNNMPPYLTVYMWKRVA